MTTEKFKKRLEIDCVPYDVCVSDDVKHPILDSYMKEGYGKYIVSIMDVEGSILKNLDNDPEITGNRFSDEWVYSSHYHEELGDVGIRVAFDTEDIITFTVIVKNQEQAFDVVYGWISENLYAIESIGCEVLKKEPV